MRQHCPNKNGRNSNSPSEMKSYASIHTEKVICPGTFMPPESMNTDPKIQWTAELNIFA